MEVLPEVPAVDLAAISLTRLVAETPAALFGREGESFVPTDWLEIDQARVDRDRLADETQVDMPLDPLKRIGLAALALGWRSRRRLAGLLRR